MSAIRTRAKTARAEAELQERDLAILQGLFESRLMTLRHVARLYFNDKSEAAKKRIQQLKRGRYIGERARRVYEPSILHLSKRAFEELSARGTLLEYPEFAWNQLEDRAKVSELTLKHELAVLDVKTALSCAVRSTPHYALVEFSTWPLLYQFQAAFSEVTTNPLGAIWMRPLDYRDITKGTLYNPSRPRTGRIGGIRRGRGWWRRR